MKITNGVGEKSIRGEGKGKAVKSSVNVFQGDGKWWKWRKAV